MASLRNEINTVIQETTYILRVNISCREKDVGTKMKSGIRPSDHVQIAAAFVLNEFSVRAVHVQYLSWTEMLV